MNTGHNIRTWIAVTAVSFGLGAGMCRADWPTHRGNMQRTGAADDKPLPKMPKVLWVYESQEHFIASPAPTDKALIVSGLGAFNTAAMHALSLELSPAQRELWSKRPPLLKQPVVCPPAISGGRLVFGDGMHQTDGGTLHGFTTEGMPLWQLPVPGSLVHLEGAPTIADGKVYIGGGAAGVICVDPARVTLEGREMDAQTASDLVAAQWKRMQAAYEEDKKKDPDFAIPPNEDALPRPAPKVLWQSGKDKLHVDAAVAVAGNRVLVATAFLDKEKVGDRAIICLDARDGTQTWRTAMELNPWSGPTLAGDMVLVGCSNIRLDPKDVPQGRGQVLALNLPDGKVLWKKNVAGGVVAPIAVSGEVAVITGTDGAVRAWNVRDGKPIWELQGGSPYFAGPAVAGGIACVADLKGTVMGMDMKDGSPLWKLDLATAAATKAPGMVYGSPVIKDGRVYVATSNLESAGQQRTVVVCIGN